MAFKTYALPPFACQAFKVVEGEVKVTWTRGTIQFQFNGRDQGTPKSAGNTKLLASFSVSQTDLMNEFSELVTHIAAEEKADASKKANWWSDTPEAA